MALESTIVCAVRNCQNNGQALRAWLGRVCFEHRPNLKADCSCPPLYDFHKLPKDPVDMRMWLKALELTDVPPNCYVCSVHFADKRPSDAHPYPELYLAGRMNPEKGLLAKTNSLTDKKKGKSATIFVDLERRFMETPTNDSGLSEEHKCELCGTCFETRRGLSSHARCHLRQLGVSVSDSSGAPIELLYRLIEERDGQLPKPPPQAKPKRGKEVMLVKKEAQGPALKLKISNLVRKKYSIFSQGASARKSSAAAASATTTTTSSSSSSSSAIAAASSSLSLSPIITVKKPFASSSASSSVISLSPVRVKDSRSNAERSPSASAAPAPAKPLWAPQDSDAPLNLMAMDPSGRDDVHVCELCGAWFETRKGLSSHARAHLRTFGIESAEAKGAPIATLQKFMVSKGLKPGSSNITQGEVKKEESAHPISVKRTAPSSPSPKASPKALGSSPSLSAKRLKASSPPEGLSVHDSSIKDDEASAKSDGESGRCVCEFCGEIFVRNQSLSSHARSHLRQLGITEWSVQGSPMATLREVMAQRGVTSILKLPTSTPSQASPSPASLLKIPQPPPSPLTLSSHLKLSNTPSQASPAHKQPKARKGSRFVNKPKDEPMEVDLSEVVAMPGPSRSDTPQSPFRSNFSSPNTQSPGRASKSELDVNQPVECEYCNDTFDSRKALSCHARAHLRHLGVRWPAQASPIDALYQLMQREGTTRAHEVKREPSSSTPPPVDTSAKDATCELCGFDFENRKALASHARAHLRQQGVDWRTNGSPIDTLSAWMLKEPAKVAELHKRYMMGDLPHIRKRNSSSPCPSSDSEAVLASSHRSSAAVRSSLGLPHGSARPSGRKGDRSQGSHSERQSRGSERRPPKHQSYAETRAREPKPSKPSRSGTIPSLVPRPPETPLVRQMGKVYSLKCRFCDKEFRGPLSVQEDWVRHLQEHILNLKRDEASASTPTSPLAPQASAAPALLLTPQPV